MRIALLPIVLWCSLMNEAAYAQQDCFSSFAVKPGRKLALEWLPGGMLGQNLSCEAAELQREKVYVQNKEMFDRFARGTPAAYISSAEQAIGNAEAKVKALEVKATANNSLSALQLAAEGNAV